MHPDSDPSYAAQQDEDFKNDKRGVSMKYRKKPVVVEAFQMTPERRQSNVNWPTWMHEAWNRERGGPGSLFPAIKGADDEKLMIGTLEGPLLVEWGDYIIQGVKGEIYPCKPDIFEATYEAVEHEPEDPAVGEDGEGKRTQWMK